MDVPQNLVAELERLERRLHDPGAADYASALDELLDDDFLEFGSSGRVYDKAAAKASTAVGGTSLRITAEGFSAKLLSEDVALLTYRSFRPGPTGESSHALRSSIWKRTYGRWRMLFHQGTPTAPK